MDIEQRVVRARAISQVSQDMLMKIRQATCEIRNITDDTDTGERDRILDAYARAQILSEVLEWLLK